MRLYRYRRLLLFLVVLILPSLAIVVLSRSNAATARELERDKFEKRDREATPIIVLSNWTPAK